MKKNLVYDTKYLDGFVSKGDLEGIFPEVEKAHVSLTEKTGPGKEFLGWLHFDKLVESRTSAIIWFLNICDN